MNTTKMSSSLDPGQARQVVGPDLNTDVLQRLPTDAKSIGNEVLIHLSKYFARVLFHTADNLDSIAHLESFRNECHV